MASLTTIRAGLSVRLKTIPNWNVYDRAPNSFTPPGAVILETGGQHEMTFGNSSARDLSRMDFEIITIASLSQGIDLAQEQTDGWVSNTGTNSVRAALDGDRTLGGIVHGLTYGQWSRIDDEEWSAQDVVARRLEVSVWAS